MSKLADLERRLGHKAINALLSDDGDRYAVVPTYITFNIYTALISAGNVPERIWSDMVKSARIDEITEPSERFKTLKEAAEALAAAYLKSPGVDP